MAERMTFFKSYLEGVEGFEDKIQLEILKAILRFGLYGEEPQNLSPVAKLAFTYARPSLEKSMHKAEVSRDNGNRGGRPKKEEPTETQENPTKPNETQEEPKKTADYRHKTIDIDIDIDNRHMTVDKDLDIEEKGIKRKDTIVSQRENRIPKETLDEFMARWNTLPSPIPKITILKPGTKRYDSLAARLDEYGIDKLMMAVENIRRSSFLCGKSSTWHISIDWFVLPNNFPKVLEGNYTDSEQEQKPKSKGSLIDDWVEKGLL
jgi:hypothetical protein